MQILCSADHMHFIREGLITHCNGNDRTKGVRQREMNDSPYISGQNLVPHIILQKLFSTQETHHDATPSTSM